MKDSLVNLVNLEVKLVYTTGIKNRCARVCNLWKRGYPRWETRNFFFVWAPNIYGTSSTIDLITFQMVKSNPVFQHNGPTEWVVNIRRHLLFFWHCNRISINAAHVYKFISARSFWLIFCWTYRSSSRARLDAFVIQTKPNCWLSLFFMLFASLILGILSVIDPCFFCAQNSQMIPPLWFYCGRLVLADA
jgi:hypothetical protein